MINFYEGFLNMLRVASKRNVLKHRAVYSEVIIEERILI